MFCTLPDVLKTSVHIFPTSGKNGNCVLLVALTLRSSAVFCNNLLRDCVKESTSSRHNTHTMNCVLHKVVTSEAVLLAVLWSCHSEIFSRVSTIFARSTENWSTPSFRSTQRVSQSDVSAHPKVLMRTVFRFGCDLKKVITSFITVTASRIAGTLGLREMELFSFRQ